MANESVSVFDAAGTLERMGGDRALLRDMAKFLAEDGPKLIQRLGQCVSQGHVLETERAAHTLKGLVSMFGANHAEQKALEVEMAAKQRDLAIAGTLLPGLQRSLDEVIAAVESYLATAD